MVLGEAKTHRLSIVAFKIDYRPFFKSGVITVEMFDYKSMTKENIKLLNKEKQNEKKQNLVYLKWKAMMKKLICRIHYLVLYLIVLKILIKYKKQ